MHVKIQSIDRLINIGNACRTKKLQRKQPRQLINRYRYPQQKITIWHNLKLHIRKQICLSFRPFIRGLRLWFDYISPAGCTGIPDTFLKNDSGRY